MFRYLTQLIPADSAFSALHVMEYISVRASLALCFAFIASLLLGPWIIRWLRSLQAIQYIRISEGKDAISLEEMHRDKSGTPSMGGLLMIGSITGAALLFCDLTQPVVWLAMGAAIGFCFLGFLDDYLKTVKRNGHGLSAKAKLAGQIVLGVAFALVYTMAYPHLVSYDPGGTSAVVEGPAFLLLPFAKNAVLGLGVMYIPFAILVLAATSNAVNLTDGLDGLAAGVTISATLCFGLVAYLAGRTIDSSYLIIPHIVGAGELTVIMAALVGACFGFLWFNSHPAEMFMGDTGSMMIGGLLGAVALLIKQEILLLVVGGVFVAETLSVILQVGSYKLRKKRIFRMAPLHHHFERGGIPESKIITRFWIVSALLALAGLVSLKIR